MKIVKVKNVGLCTDVNRKICRRLVQVPKNILYRMFVFNAQQTQLIECKDDQIAGSRFANRFSSDHVIAFASLMTTHNRASTMK